ncbi:MAG: YwbE family protein [Acidobacteriota bacterium]|nr:YwbE family protein [Acidobacteriota bacterium]
MEHQERKNIRAGLRVAIVLKQDQRTGKQTVGTVKDLLTNSAFHPHGIKVRLTSGEVGRVQEILADE